MATYSANPTVEWTAEEVAEWAQKVCKFSENSAKILIEQEIDGETLFDPPVSSLPYLISILPNVPTGKVKKMWEKLRPYLPNNNPTPPPPLTLERHLENLSLDTLNEESKKAVQTFMTPKKTPSKSAIFLAHRLYQSDSPLHLNQKIISAIQQDNDEHVLGIQLLMASVKKPTCSESATNDHTMPFKDRNTEAKELRKCIKYNLLAYKTNLRRKNQYYFAVVTSGTGFGKTRFCKEIPNLIKSMPNVRVKLATFKFTELANNLQLPSNLVTIHIDLSNGDRIQDWHLERQEYLMNTKIYLENLIGRRIAAHALWDCSYDDLLGTLGYQGKTDSLGLLTLDAVLKTIGRQYGSTSANPVGILLMLDEINYLFKYDGVASAIINMLGSYMTSDTVSRQRDAGVILFPVISGTAVNGVADSFLSSKFGRKFILLGLLSLKSSKQIFCHCLPTKQHWLSNKRIVRLLLLYGNTPAVLQRIIELTTTKDDDLNISAFNSLIEDLEGEVSTSQFELPSLNVTHIDIVLAGVKANNKMSASFQKLEDDGVVLVNLFGGAYNANPTDQIILQQTFAVSCHDKLLITKSHKLDLNESLLLARPTDYFQYSMLAAPGNALFDIVEFYRSTTGQYIVVFKQMKQLENSEADKNIGEGAITTWLEEMRASTDNLDQNDYKCYYMLITNKRIPSAKSLISQYPDLFIVDQSNFVDYYGPTVATFAELVSLDEIIATNSEN